MNPTSQLTDTLNKIEIWLQKNIPEKADRLKPGLFRQNIEDKVKNLPFKVPESIYELYQWHNGLVEKFAFNNYDFLSLENSLAAYEESLGEVKYYQKYYQLEQGDFFEQSLPFFEN